jgi:hypothetical protein
MWATVRTLLPFVVVLNLALLALGRIGPGAIGVLDATSGAAMSVAAGCVARGRGRSRGQAIWAAWWLGVCAIPLNWLENVTGLRTTPQLTPIPVPPGVSTLVNVADPNTVGMLVIGVLIAAIIVGILSLLVITPFALLGYWAYGERGPAGGVMTGSSGSSAPAQGASRAGAVQLMDWFSVFVVVFDLAMQGLFRYGGLDPHQPLAGLDARGLDPGMVAFLIVTLLIGLMVYPCAAWLAIRLVYALVRRARA